MMPEVTHEARAFDHLGALPRKVRGPAIVPTRIRCRQRRYVQNSHEVAFGPEERQAVAAQADLGRVKVVVAMASDGHALLEARSNSIGACVLFLPVGTRQQPGAWQAAVPRVVADIIYDHAFGVCHKDVADISYALRELLYAGARDLEKIAELVADFREMRRRLDKRLMLCSRIQTMQIDAAIP
ncbi:MAG: hypothetical protein WDN31_04375 [Hyphomicrobium sp.]